MPCKKFRHEPYQNPNNYDLHLSPQQIPANIPRENATNLKTKLQKILPLTKKLHINYDITPETITEHNECDISTRMLINGQEVDFK